jgi:hypothetical protein
VRKTERRWFTKKKRSLAYISSSGSLRPCVYLKEFEIVKGMYE